MIVSGDNGLPLFGIAGVERLGYYTLSPAKVHGVQTIYQVHCSITKCSKFSHNIGAKHRT